MTSENILALRLKNQYLSTPAFNKPSDLVSHLVAVQAQDYAAAKWGLGLRMKHATDEIIENSFNKGEILRTHIMRPTWHFIMPEDLVWMQDLTAGNVKRLMGSYNKKLELDDKLFKKSNAVIAKALKNHNYLTRQEIKKLLEEINIKTDVQRLAHIVMWAELDAVICSGPRKGKQFTYALVEERVTKSKKLSRDEALAKLTLKYFTGHGPAQIKDFSWWSGLSIKEATEGLTMVKSKLNSDVVNNKTYWFSPVLQMTNDQSPKAYLLSIYDEYTIAYKDRSDISEKRDIERFITMGNALTSVIILGGIAVGTWKRILKKDRVEIDLNLFRKVNKNEQGELKKAAERLGKFLGLKAVLKAQLD